MGAKFVRWLVARLKGHDSSFECHAQHPDSLSKDAMTRKIVYLVDEDEVARRALPLALQKFLEPAPVEVRAIPPLKEFADYDGLLAQEGVAAFLLDQKLKTTGEVNYTGIELAEHLRAVAPKLPIYILTAWADERDEFVGAEYRVEEILDKADIEDRDSDKANTIRARFLRRLDVFEDVLNKREQRFHDLLVKSLKEPLTVGELKEMEVLEGERLAPVVEAERTKAQELDAALDELSLRVRGEKLI